MTRRTFWFNKNVLVTGASGFLGAYLVEKLVKLGAKVIVIVRDNVPQSRFFSENIYKEVTSVRGDIVDFFLLERTISEYEIEIVFHLAAQTIVNIANRSPLSTFESNIKGTWNLLESCRKNDHVKRIIVASTDKAYGEKEQLPYYEIDKLSAMHPYDMSKAIADMLCQGYAETYGLPVGITRCGNLYGGGDLNFTRIIPQTIRHILLNENPILRSDGTSLRDYFYVGDAVDSYLLFMENLIEKKLVGEAFNFGTEYPISVLELVNKLLHISGNDHLTPIIMNNAKGEIKDQYLSCKKAHEMLDWKPKYTLNEGLKKTYDWYVKNIKTIDDYA